jgi:hypothetical protein
MTGYQSPDPTCRYCGAEITYAGALWLMRNVADINGYCTKSPDDDLHHPVAATGTRRPDSHA